MSFLDAYNGILQSIQSIEDPELKAKTMAEFEKVSKNPEDYRLKNYALDTMNIPATSSEEVVQDALKYHSQKHAESFYENKEMADQTAKEVYRNVKDQCVYESKFGDKNAYGTHSIDASGKAFFTTTTHLTEKTVDQSVYKYTNNVNMLYNVKDVDEVKYHRENVNGEHVNTEEKKHTQIVNGVTTQISNQKSQQNETTGETKIINEKISTKDNVNITYEESKDKHIHVSSLEKQGTKSPNERLSLNMKDRCQSKEVDAPKLTV